MAQLSYFIFFINCNNIFIFNFFFNFEIIRKISENGTTILLVEQNAYKALSIADRAYILETGNIIKEGDAKVLINDSSIKAAYLGG